MTITWPNKSLRLLLISIAGLSLSATAMSTNWPPAGYKEVRAYIFNLDGHSGARILETNQLSDTVVNREGVRLGKLDIERLLQAAVVLKPIAVARSLRCYVPRHAFVFYDDDKKPVGFVEICFECSRHRTSASDPLIWEFDLKALRKLFTDLKISVFEKGDDYLLWRQKPKSEQ